MNNGAWNNNPEHGNDIALVKTKVAMPLSDNLFPACLPKKDFCFKGDLGSDEGSDSHLSGWGQLSFGGDFPDHLMGVEVPITTWNYCKSKYGELSPDVFCSGLKVGGKDACLGDSGGPNAVRVDGVWYREVLVKFRILG